MLYNISLLLIYFTYWFVSLNPIPLSHPSPVLTTSFFCTSETLLLTLPIFICFGLYIKVQIICTFMREKKFFQLTLMLISPLQPGSLYYTLIFNPSITTIEDWFFWKQILRWRFLCRKFIRGYSDYHSLW